MTSVDVSLPPDCKVIDGFEAPVNCIVISIRERRSRIAYHVTVDLERRCFAVGRGTPRHRRGLYEGQGWKQRLVDDAVKELREVIGQ